jgi:hypothetical protein
MEKKSERLEVRLGYQEKQDFTEACNLQGDTPSGAVRRFINGYVRRSDGEVLASVWRGSAKRKLVPALTAMGVLAILIGGTYHLLSRAIQPNASEIFSFRDVNGDGELEYSEHAIPPGMGGQPNGVLRVLDLDASGTISRDEFVPKGRMVYMLETDRSDTPTDKKYPANLVEFDIGKHRAKTGTYEGATINADDLDRLVVWPINGAPTVLEGKVMISSGIDNIEFQADTVTVPAKPN